jgi:hypothetical protein
MLSWIKVADMVIVLFPCRVGIGGTIGTALYVSIGHGVLNGGPASLFLAFTIW